MAAFNVGALVQKKTGGIHGVVDSQLEPDSDHPKAWVCWDDGNTRCITNTNFARLLLMSLACIRN